MAMLPNGWFGYENARWSECTNFISTCKPTKSACADYLCAQCLSDGGAGFKSCCSQPTPYLCFQTAEGGGGGGGGGGSPYITAAPSPVITDPQQQACLTAANILQSCESATSGFDNLADSVAASCMCYSGSNWQPQAFDQPWSSCVAWASTADVSDYSAWTNLDSFCSSVGDVMNSPATIAATTTPGSPNVVATGAGGSVQEPTGGTSSNNGAGMLRPTGMTLKMFMTVAICITAEIFIF